LLAVEPGSARVKNPSPPAILSPPVGGREDPGLICAKLKIYFQKTLTIKVNSENSKEFAYLSWVLTPPSGVLRMTGILGI
jgi:hypothetical protein